jgi:type VI secretion system protein ImpJ
VRRHGAACRLTDFLPPTLQVTPGSALGRRCRPISQMLRDEASTVTDQVRLSAIVATLPAFEVMLAGNPHPFALYVELCRVAGAAAALRNDVIPSAFPPYDHDAARGGFETVVRYILKETGEKVSGSFKRFTFESDGSRFRLRPDPGWTDTLAPVSGSELVLAIECDDATAQRWGENCVIATSSIADALLTRRLLGCARRRVMPGAALPSGPNLHHFQITPDAGSLKPGEDLLVIGNLGGPEPSALHLYVIGAAGTP